MAVSKTKKAEPKIIDRRPSASEVGDFVHLVFANEKAPAKMREMMARYGKYRHLLPILPWKWNGHVTAIGAACWWGNKPAVEFLLKEGAVNDIYSAVLLEELPRIKSYLDVSPDLVHARSPHAYNIPLLYVFMSKSTMDLLVSYGAKPDVNVFAYQGWLPEVKKALEEEPGCVNLDSFWNQKPLNWALQRKHYQITELLIDYGADLNHPGSAFRTMTPLILACQDLNVPMALLERMVAGGAKVDRFGPNGNTPLSAAVQCGNVAAVELLLKHGADPRQKDGRGVTPIELAAKKGIDAISALFKAF